MLDLQSFKGFTPGSWSAFATDSDNGRFTVERLGSNQFVPSRKIAIVHVDKGNGEANARLISRAPDLLSLAIKQEAEIKRLREALEKLANATDDLAEVANLNMADDALNAARAALEPSNA